MGFLRVKSCCGCNSLKSGCVKIAIANLVLCVLGLLGTASNGSVLSNIGSALLGIIANAMLLTGVKSNKPPFVLVWLIITGIQIMLCIVAIALLAFAGAMLTHVMESGKFEEAQGPKTGIDDMYPTSGYGQGGQEVLNQFFGQTTKGSGGGFDADGDGIEDMTTEQAVEIVNCVVIGLAVVTAISTMLYMYFWVVVKSYYDEMGPSGSNAVVVTAAIEVDDGLPHGFTVPAPAPAALGGPGTFVPDGPPPAYDETYMQKPKMGEKQEKC